MSSPATPLIDATDSRITDSCGARWSSSASVRSIRARSARWATSSRLIEGAVEAAAVGHAENPRRGAEPPRGRYRVVNRHTVRASVLPAPSRIAEVSTAR